MIRQNVLLAALAHGASLGRAFRPVHVQKIMFLLDQKIPDVFDQNSRYHFAPYDYGPFDKGVYDDLDVLELSGDVEIDRESGYGYRLYQATPQGISKGTAYLADMTPAHRDFVRRTVNLLLPLGFRTLVTAIYRHYPEMKQNSVFR